MPSINRYDAIIIGTGQSGKPLAGTLARAGWKVAVIERKHVGGTCVNVGCTPTKTMIASARIAYLARQAASYGVNLRGVSVDMARVYARKQGIVESFRKSGQDRLESTPNLELIFGAARFKNPRTVEVRLNAGGTREITADKIVINTGGNPALPPIPGLREAQPLNSSTIMELQALPEHLLVLGGSYIGLEFAQMFRRFGSRVTIIHRDGRLINREDPDVSEEVQKIMSQDGIEIALNAQVAQISRQPNGRIEVTVTTPGGNQRIAGSHLLAALGRVPSTAELNLAAAGIETDNLGFIKVNNKLESNVPGIYAIGDVKGGPAFTHISYDDFRILRANWLEGGNATIEGRLVPNTMFIDPQLASVGLNETQARAQKRNFRVAKLPMAHVARAIEMGETRGFMKAIVDADTGQVLGCTVLGVEGGEIMAMLEVAMMGGVHYTKIKEGIFAHPTLAESLNNLFLAMDG
ncbi:MAG TPA: mercuric reductase [Burkholderiales bacterium]|nr:mercuric reductase [Burkholderiales bacterium]